MFRHRSAGEIARFAVHHPLEVLEFPFRLYSTFDPSVFKVRVSQRRSRGSHLKALGHADYTEPFASLSLTCKLPATYLAQTGDQSVRELIPVPSCTNSADLLKRSFAQHRRTAMQAIASRIVCWRPFLHACQTRLSRRVFGSARRCAESHHRAITSRSSGCLGGFCPPA